MESAASSPIYPRDRINDMLMRCGGDDRDNIRRVSREHSAFLRDTLDQRHFDRQNLARASESCRALDDSRRYQRQLDQLDQLARTHKINFNYDITTPAGLKRAVARVHRDFASGKFDRRQLASLMRPLNTLVTLHKLFPDTLAMSDEDAAAQSQAVTAIGCDPGCRCAEPPTAPLCHPEQNAGGVEEPVLRLPKESTRSDFPSFSDSRRNEEVAAPQRDASSSSDSDRNPTGDHTANAAPKLQSFHRESGPDSCDFSPRPAPPPDRTGAPRVSHKARDQEDRSFESFKDYFRRKAQTEYEIACRVAREHNLPMPKGPDRPDCGD